MQAMTRGVVRDLPTPDACVPGTDDPLPDPSEGVVEELGGGSGAAAEGDCGGFTGPDSGCVAAPDGTALPAGEVASEDDDSDATAEEEAADVMIQRRAAGAACPVDPTGIGDAEALGVEDSTSTVVSDCVAASDPLWFDPIVVPPGICPTISYAASSSTSLPPVDLRQRAAASVLSATVAAMQHRLHSILARPALSSLGVASICCIDSVPHRVRNPADGVRGCTKSVCHAVRDWLEGQHSRWSVLDSPFEYTDIHGCVLNFAGRMNQPRPLTLHDMDLVLESYLRGMSTDDLKRFTRECRGRPVGAAGIDRSGLMVRVVRGWYFTCFGLNAMSSGFTIMDALAYLTFPSRRKFVVHGNQSLGVLGTWSARR